MAISLHPASFQPAYDGDKFQELLLYITSACADDPRFGATKLNKILFFSDFLAYGRLGKAITGASYQKLPFGPAARATLPAMKALETSGHAEMIECDFFGNRQKRLVAKREPNLSAFSPEEIAIVDRVIKALWKATAKGVSVFSHEESIGWKLAGLKEDIPYQTVFLSPRQPSIEDFDRGKELAEQHGW